jgi:hypothetical protein
MNNYLRRKNSVVLWLMVVFVSAFSSFMCIEAESKGTSDLEGIGHWKFEIISDFKVKDSSGGNSGLLSGSKSINEMKHEKIDQRVNEWVELAHHNIITASENIYENKLKYKRGRDYEIDYSKGTVKVLSSGRISKFSKLDISYLYKNPEAQLTEGRVGKALMFDGRDDEVVIKANKDLNINNKFTVEAWVKFSKQTPWGGLIVGRRVRNGDWQAFGYALHQRTPNSIMGTLSDGKKVASVSAKGIKNDVWYYVVMTADGKKLRLYIDGELKSEKIYDFNIQRGGDTIIGGKWSKHYFNGAIDEVKIFSKAKSTDKVFQDFSSIPGEISVGIYKAGSALGPEAIYDALIDAKGITPHLIQGLDPKNISRFKVIIFPGGAFSARRRKLEKSFKKLC